MKNIAALAYIVKHLQTGELTHVRNCEFAADMWDALKSFYDIQGDHHGGGGGPERLREAASGAA